MKIFIYLTAILLTCIGSNVYANAIDDEIERLAGLRDYRIRQCTSPECRELQKAKYQISIAKLKKDPLEYFANLNLKKEQETCVDQNLERKIKLKCIARWPNDRELRNICIETLMKESQCPCE